MNIETVLIMYRNVINYEVTRVLHENIDLWDEAIQESFIRINGNLESILKKEGKYRENYIRVIVRNAARTILSNRRNFHAKNVSFEEWIAYEENAENLYEKNSSEEELSLEMEHCLRMLEPEERDILYLREVEELPYDEIAKALGITKEACRKRVSRAKRHFKQIITESKEGRQVIRGRVKNDYGKY